MGLTTDRDSNCLKLIRLDGMQECYLILSEEERAKGYVRPLRRSYKHRACGGVTIMAHEIAETYAVKPEFYSGTYCVRCRTHFPLATYKEGAIERHFEWLDERTATPDGSYVGE